VPIPKYITGANIGTGSCNGSVVTPSDYGNGINGPANWLKQGATYLWLENDPVNFDPLGGSIQVAGLQQRSAAEADFYTSIAPSRVTTLQGQTLTCGGRLKQAISSGVGTARFFVSVDGAATYSTAMPLSIGNYQSLQVSIGQYRGNIFCDYTILCSSFAVQSP